ncbi:MAG: tetratricopeptide repeat protein, partial [Syntrophales bacterium LBB04]|nr:tetratricopeptide repeat protein [Syntrophales bacterium LBB04]
MADLAMRQGRPERAASEMEQALKLQPDSAPLHAGLMQAYLAQKKYARAVSFCEEQIARRPQDAFLRNLLGEVEATQKSYKKAEEAFRKAVELQPDWPPPHGNLAKLYLVQGQTGAAVKVFEEALKGNPDDAGAYLSLAQIYIQSREYPKAIGVLEKLNARKPDFWVAASDLAFLLSENSGGKKDLERALSLAKRAQETRPEEPAVLDTLGWIYYKMGDNSAALTYLARAAGKSAESGRINYHLGVVNQKSGKVKEAKDYFKKAAESKEAFEGKEEARRMMGEN